MEKDTPDRKPYEGRFIDRGKTWMGTPTCDVAPHMGKTESNLIVSLELARSGKPDADLLYCDAPEGLTGSRIGRIRRTKLISHRCVKWMIQTCRESDKAGWEAIESAFPFKRRQGNHDEQDSPLGGSENGSAEQASAFDDEEVAAEPQAPVVYNKDRETLTTSLAVARAYGKAHRHVLRDIDLILGTSPNLGALFVFRKTIYIGGNGEARPMYEMNEDAFSLLVGGFTGAEALRFRIAYISEFNRMKKALGDSAPIDMNDPNVLRQILLGYTYKLEESRAETEEEKRRRIIAETKAAAETQRALQQEEIAGKERVAREAAEAEKARMAPKAEYFDDLVNRVGLYSYTDSAKMLGQRRDHLITLLLNPPLKWHFRFNHVESGRLVPYESAIRSGYMAVQSKAVRHPETGEMVDRETARITEKGIQFLRQFLKGPFKLVS